MRCIVTGFDGFGGLDENPSSLAVQLLPDYVESGEVRVQITKATLPTCCEDAWEKLSELIQAGDGPLLLLLTGVAQTRTRIGLERFGLNIRDYRIPDNQGHQWVDSKIVEGGPDAIRTNLRLPAFQTQLMQEKIHCEVSNHAGSFVCNDLYFRALHRWQSDDVTVLFVHVPRTFDYKKEEAATEPPDEEAEESRKVLSEYARAIEIIVSKWAEGPPQTSVPSLEVEIKAV